MLRKIILSMFITPLQATSGHFLFYATRLKKILLDIIKIAFNQIIRLMDKNYSNIGYRLIGTFLYGTLVIFRFIMLGTRSSSLLMLFTRFRP